MTEVSLPSALARLRNALPLALGHPARDCCDLWTQTENALVFRFRSRRSHLCFYAPPLQV